ncbi:MAG: 2-amino-4-hydroxy-6-hydroxymethyldihydropteridine diphosphokinase [candidate division Zixibacteria bacterium RBG_19FT_COMBO_42_43]|nr:MAG: 2-amino-4-hydroxy-6-hydroxymethyldihydropteridine diphosphokinase [candidate division Zixibacteria bacterium RBG_19FT_COMBO_42_43]
MVFLGVGSNLGDRLENINNAIAELKKSKKIKILKSSSIYETQPWEVKSPEWFLNLVLKVETGLPPLQLLDFLEKLESKSGRESKSDKHPRSLDIDILFYNDLIFYTERLVVPHPVLHKRRFVLVPLAEIEPELEHPQLHKDIKTILENLEDKAEVRLFQKVEELG